jgi:hypothetical protein
VGEWALHSERIYDNPFFDVVVEATFAGPSGQTVRIPAFYDGERTWRVRFSPGEAGRWTYQTSSVPADPALEQEGAFEAIPSAARGFLQATPGEAWGFGFESGEPAFLLGDTTYNLFGMAHCGGNVDGFLKRRAAQGFNLFRVRLQVSSFHGPKGHSAWQTRRTWPWGGSEQKPQFDRFNLEYFGTVDQVMRCAEAEGVGFEMVMEAWGFEYPFRSRAVFLPEWEDLWLRYLIARYDAFSSVYFWTPMNEYEYYPNGDWRYNPVADRWAMRVGRWIKDMAPHGHVVSIHNGPQMPPFAQRFALDPGAIDAIMFQAWGTTGRDDGWLASGIEESIRKSLAGWRGSAIFAEYGYERNPDLPLNLPHHEFCDAEHTRRGAWRGAFCALPVIHGFENSWGPFMLLEEDQPGLACLVHLRRFFTVLAPFHRLRQASQIVLPGEHGRGFRPLALATEERDVVAAYLPTGGSVTLDLPADRDYTAQWFDPRTGKLAQAPVPEGDKVRFEAPTGADRHGHPWDWVLLLVGSRE